MTTQEAIEHLKSILIYSCYQDGYTDGARTALDMAIEAMKAQEHKPDEKDHLEQGDLAEFGVKTCETCADAISRQAAIDAIKRAVTKEAAIWSVESLPSAQTERTQGRWIPQDNNKVNGMTSTTAYYYPKCSVCGHCANYTNFCPDCGADMRGKQNMTGLTLGHRVRQGN